MKEFKGVAFLMSCHSGRYRTVAQTSLKCTSRGGTKKNNFSLRGGEKCWGWIFLSKTVFISD